MRGEVLSVEEVGKRLALSTSAVWRLLQQGEIPGAKIGGQWRIRVDDLERAFDLARARALAQSREKESEEAWAPVVRKLAEKYKGPFVLTRCLWCPESTPAAESARYTTLCSPECAAELRQTFDLLGWPKDWELMLSPIYDVLGDSEYWVRMSLGKAPVSAMIAGVERDYEAVQPKWELRHQRGPLRELLLLEHPLLRRYAAPVTAARVAAALAKRSPKLLEELVDDEAIRKLLEAETEEEVYGEPDRDALLEAARKRQDEAASAEE